MDNEKFKQDLDELFRLFNLLMEKQSKSLDEIPGVNKMMLDQFRMFFSNYETMKDQIAYQLQGQFGEPIYDMVHTLIQQLKEELGDDELLQSDSSEDFVLPIIKQEKPVEDVQDEIAKIDKLLKNPNLTQTQIDALLDRRMELNS